MNSTLRLAPFLSPALATLLFTLALAAPPERTRPLPQRPPLPAERTLPVDPVELLAGREVPGKEEFTLEHEGLAYRFTSPENQAAFEKDPGKFAVFEGGACARMGALAGMGDARRYALHDNRIFCFASDGCRSAFLKEPGKYIETEDEKVFGSEAQVQQGRAALDRMTAWAGGAERIRALSTWRASSARSETQGGTQYRVTNETSIAFPDRCYQKESWNDAWFSMFSIPEGAAMGSTDGTEKIAASRGRAFQRSLARWPIVILKAHVDGAPRADCPGLIVMGDGEGTLGEVPVEYIKVWLNGAASRLTIEKESGKLLQLAYHGRDGTMKVGDSLRTFTAWATVEGVTLPTAYRVTFDGADLPQSAAKIDAFEVNPALPAELFNLPGK